MFEVTVELKELGQYSSFAEAFRAFFNQINELIKQRGMSLMALETVCWIEHNGIPLLFHDAKDLAHEPGLISEEGKLLEVKPLAAEKAFEKDAKVQAVYQAVHDEQLFNFLQEIKENTEKLLEKLGRDLT